MIETTPFGVWLATKLDAPDVAGQVAQAAKAGDILEDDLVPTALYKYLQNTHDLESGSDPMTQYLRITFEMYDQFLESELPAGIDPTEEGA